MHSEMRIYMRARLPYLASSFPWLVEGFMSTAMLQLPGLEFAIVNGGFICWAVQPAGCDMLGLLSACS